MNNSILLIGRPHSAKTVFLSQFYKRLQKKKSNLSLYKPISDISPIYSALDALAAGDEPQSTNAELHSDFILPIQFKEKHIDLVCPDYGGEQINKILLSRELDTKWSEAVKNSNNWLFFIRLNSLNKSQDISEIIPDGVNIKVNPNEIDVEYGISEQTFFIELLQILLYYKENDFHYKNDSVHLTITLTCWDELNYDGNPCDIFNQELPLLYEYIRANWKSDMIKIVGLSPLGFSLKIPENKEKYELYGPESYGFLVNEDGTTTKDITELIEMLIN